MYKCAVMRFLRAPPLQIQIEGNPDGVMIPLRLMRHTMRVPVNGRSVCIDQHMWPGDLHLLLINITTNFKTENLTLMQAHSV